MKKAVFNCDTCDYEKSIEFFQTDSFKESSMDLVFKHKTDIMKKLERPTRELCSECQKKAIEELKNFLAGSKYFY